MIQKYIWYSYSTFTSFHRYLIISSVALCSLPKCHCIVSFATAQTQTSARAPSELMAYGPMGHSIYEPFEGCLLPLPSIAQIVPSPSEVNRAKKFPRLIKAS